MSTRQTPADEAVPWPDRFYEDYAVGDELSFGSVTMDEGDMIDFALRYDPQPFHIDREAAAASLYGGLIASGWQTGSLMMRMLTEGMLGPSSMGSPGLDEVRWTAPVRPGDQLSVRVEILEMRTSRSKPDRGIIRMRQQMVNQNDVVVMTQVANMMIARR